MRYIDMTGSTVGLWRILQKDSTKSKRAYWICECISCGATQSVAGNHIRENIKGGCKSCRTKGNKHKYPKEYSVWQSIKCRVFNPNRKDYPRYSKLGMHTPWVNDFMAFYNAVGERPSMKHSIDRIDTNIGYYPGNVRWATSKEQANNTIRNIRIGDESLTDYATRLGIPYNTARDRYHRMGENNALRRP